MQDVWNEDLAKKTQMMTMNETAKPKGMQRCITLDRVPLEQLTRFKYLGSWITDDARSDEDIRSRVGMAKAAFWQNQELMRSNIKLSTKMKNCYLFSVLDYGCESWTWNRPMRMKVNAFERLCYRMILGISWRDHVSTPEVMDQVQFELHTGSHFTGDMIKRKMEYAGHVLRGSSDLSHLQILEGRVEGKKKVSCPIRIWMNDIWDWSLLGTYGKVKRAAEDRKRWKLIVVNLRNGVDK